MRGAFPLLAEVAGGGDDPAAEVVLPEPVDDHPRQQVAGPPVDVGEPVRQGRPAIRRARPFGGSTRQCSGPSGVRVRTCKKPCVASPCFWFGSPRLRKYAFSKKSAPCVWNRIAGRPSLVTITFVIEGFGSLLRLSRTAMLSFTHPGSVTR